MCEGGGRNRVRILVVEDEDKVASFIRKGLEQMAYTVETAGTGEEALALALSTRYDAIVLDVMLPGRDGLSVVRELRARGSDAPVLALTARGTLEDRIAGLDSGCDDYLPKPFAFEELLARLRALLRRGGTSRMPRLEYAGIALDPATRSVSRDGKVVELTNKEFALLELLMRRPGQVLTRTTLMESVWGYDFDSTSNVLEVYMNFLRKKVDLGFPRKLLHTVRGVGYVLRDEGE
jgi:DNA-binding response OmpR family regulator